MQLLKILVLNPERISHHSKIFSRKVSLTWSRLFC